VTKAGQTVGDGYVAPGFVIDGPPVTVPPRTETPKAETPKIETPKAEPVRAEAPAAPAAEPALPVMEKVGAFDPPSLPAAKAPEAEKTAEPVVAVAPPAPVEATEIKVEVVEAPAVKAEEIKTEEVKLADAIMPAAGASAMPRQLAAQLAQASDANDPLEPINRVIFDVNHFLERLILRPVAEMYVLFLPQEARDGIRNFLRNVRTPIVLANDLLQGEGDRAIETTQRFFINSTLGIGGIIDAADKMGIKHHDEDLGQTFAVWGVGEMVYIVLPILGPSNPRDAVGGFLDRYFDPVWYWEENTDRDEVGLARTVVSGVDSYSRVMDDLKKLKETSIDYYAAIRSIYRQKREADIRNGKAKDVPLPDIRYDFNADVNIN
jgi:phospholipid-binding lipoprotein MlaA